MKKKILLGITLVFLVFTAGDWIYVNRYNLGDFKNRLAYTSGWRTYPEASNYTFYPISDLMKKDFPLGWYNTQGYVVYKSNAEWCNRPWDLPWFFRWWHGGQQWCKLRMALVPSYIVISENNESFRSHYPPDHLYPGALPSNQLYINADNLGQFQLGKKYTFSINITLHTSDKYESKDSPDNPIQDVLLIGYSEQK